MASIASTFFFCSAIRSACWAVCPSGISSNPNSLAKDWRWACLSSNLRNFCLSRYFIRATSLASCFALMRVASSSTIFDVLGLLRPGILGLFGSKSLSCSAILSFLFIIVFNLNISIICYKQYLVFLYNTPQYYWR